MNLRLYLFLVVLAMSLSTSTFAQDGRYPSLSERKVSKGNTTYFIDPNTGSDANIGTAKNKPWKTFFRVNQLVLSAGDAVEVLSAGAFHEALMLMAKGNAKQPVKVKFAAGRYDLYPEGALKQQLHISNTNNTPYVPKAIALMFDGCEYTQIIGKGADFVLRGKMIETYINSCKTISIDGLSFDYQRPTMSELKVLDVHDGYAELEIHQDSKFEIRDSVLTWVGEGWRHPAGYYWQKLDLRTGDLARIDFKMKNIRFAQVEDRKVRAYYRANPGFVKDMVYQSRDIVRDCAGFFMQHSKNISLKNIRIYYMHGMGIVGQLCENIKLDHIVVRPDEQSGRTSAAWADIVHFSGCKGKIEIANSYLSAANDDAINIHGVHLKIKEIIGKNQLKVAYMHHETFGFDPYLSGDSIEFIRPQNLLSIGSDVVLSSEMLNDKEILLTLKDPVLASVTTNEVIENTTATPQVWIHHNTITRIPTRGILVTSRRKMVIEKNDFLNTHMHSILVNDDGSYWYESGLVRDLTIRGNRFIGSGEPVIAILPEISETGKSAVHSGIKILNNSFDLKGSKLFLAKSTSNIVISGNSIKMWGTTKKMEELLELKDCADVETKNNKISRKDD